MKQMKKIFRLTIAVFLHKIFQNKLKSSMISFVSIKVNILHFSVKVFIKKGSMVVV